MATDASGVLEGEGDGVKVSDGCGVIVTVGDGDAVGGIGEGARVGRGGRLIVAEGDGNAVWSISTEVPAVSAFWHAATNKSRVIQNLFPIWVYRMSGNIRMNWLIPGLYGLDNQAG